MGWPREIPEPLTLNLVVDVGELESPPGQHRTSTCTAKKASLISTKGKVVEAESGSAEELLRPRRRGRCPSATARIRTAAQPFRATDGLHTGPSSSSRSSATTDTRRRRRSAGWSCPAVTVPPRRHGAQLRQRAAAGRCRGVVPSSRSNVDRLAATLGTSTATISSSKAPACDGGRSPLVAAGGERIRCLAVDAVVDARFSAVSIMPLISPKRHAGCDLSRPDRADRRASDCPTARPSARGGRVVLDVAHQLRPRRR